MNRIEILEGLYDLNVYKFFNQKQFSNIEKFNTLIKRIALLGDMIRAEKKELLEEGNIWD